MSNTFLTRLSAILILIVMLLLYFIGCNFKKHSRKIDEQANLITALNGTLKVSRLTDSSQKATISVLSTQKTSDFLAIKTKDSTINALQVLVKRYEKQIKPGGSITVVTGKTDITDSGKTNTVYLSDTTGGHPVWPTYKTLLLNKWYSANMRINRDSAYINLTITNSYDVIIGKDNKNKWFADVINHNPYSSTTQLRTYQVQVPKTRQKRLIIGFFGGYGIPLNGTFHASPMIGVGVGYSLFSLF